MRRLWRQFWRKRINPIPRSHAEKMKQTLSVIYSFMGYNALGLCLILLTQLHYPKTELEKKQPGRYYARLYQEGDATVYKISGLQVVDQYEIEGTPDLYPEEYDEMGKENPVE